MSGIPNFSTEIGTSGEPFFFVPKVHFTQAECSKATDSKLVSSKSVDESTLIVPNEHFTGNTCLQATHIKNIFSKPEESSALEMKNTSFLQKQAHNGGNVRTSDTAKSFINKGSGERFNLGRKMPLPEKESSQESCSVPQSSKLVDEIARRIENLPLLERSRPFITHARIVSTSESPMNLEARSANEVSLQTRYNTEGFENLLSSCQQNITRQLINRQIKGPREEMNSKDNLQADDSYFQNNPLQDDISFKYRQLYFDTHPTNHDFAMSLMAYIEFLNDSSWRETQSFFSINVQKTIFYLWNRVKVFLNNQTELQKLSKTTFQRMLFDFSKSWDQKENHQIIENCVMLCQMGVRARKHELKEAPLDVIYLLRKRIGQFEETRKVHFETIVANCAEELINST